MERTKNLNLGLWEGTDFPNYTLPNENMNTLDTVIKEVQVKANNNTSNIERLTLENNSIRSDLSRLFTETGEQRTEFSENIEENAQAIESLDDTLTTVNNNLNTLRDTVNKNTNDISNVKSDIALVKSDVTNKFVCLLNNTIVGGDCTVDTLVSKVIPSWLSIDAEKKIHLNNDNDKYLITFTGYIKVTNRTGVMKTVIATNTTQTIQITNDINTVSFINQRVVSFTSVNDIVTMPRYTIDESTNNISFVNCKIEISKIG